MQLDLPMFSKWHECLDLVTMRPPSLLPCDEVNPPLWIRWCDMKGRPHDNAWGLWSEHDVVEWVNGMIRAEIDEAEEKRNGAI